MTNSCQSTENVSPTKGGNQQYSIRHMFALTFVASIICGFMGMFVRQLPSQQRFGGAVFLIVSVICILVILGVSGYRRAIVDRKAGRRIHISNGRVTSWHHISGVTSCIAMLGFLVVMMYLILGLQENKHWLTTLWQFLYFTWVIGAYASNYLLSVFVWKADSNCIEVRENGILQGFYNFLHWESLHCFKWNKYSNKLMLFVENRFFEFSVPENNREDLEKALAKFIEKRKPFS